MKKIILYFLVTGYLFSACTNQTNDHHYEDPENRATKDSFDHLHKEPEREGHEHEDHEHEGHEHEGQGHDEHDHEIQNEEEHADHMHSDAEVLLERHEHEGHNHEADLDHDLKEPDEAGHEAHHPDHGIISLERQTFSEVIRSSGQIMNTQGNEVILTAIHNGIVLLASQDLLPGNEVNKNSRLLTISGSALVHDNIRTGYQEAYNAYLKAKLNYERGQELAEDRIISEREFQDLKIAYENALNNYDIMRQNYSDGGRKVTSPISGYLKEIYVAEGEYVETGEPLLKIAENKHLLIQADVPQEYFNMLDQIRTANFRTSYDKNFYQVDELNGKVVSYGKSTGESSLFLPLFFRIENRGNLIPGAFVEIFLQGHEIPGSIVVPKSAVLEESGSHYVFVKEGEEFAKHYVKLDGFDGISYRVTDGLSAGMEIATKNTYLIKLSQLSGSLPQHTHSH